MNLLFRTLGVLLVPLAASAASLRTIADIQKAAVPYHSEIRLPEWERTPEQITASTKAAIAAGDAALDRIAHLKPDEVTFENTIKAFDDATSIVGLAQGRIDFIQNTSPTEAMRDAAQVAVKELSQWGIGVQYRQDVYHSLRAYADTHPKLSGEEKRLFEFTMRDYRRAGFELSAETRSEVEKMRKELTSLETDFRANAIKVKAPVVFTKAQLAGLPADFLKEIKTGDDAYTVMVNVTPQRLTVEENCSVDATRRKVTEIEFSMAKDVNLPLLVKIVGLRREIAHRLGYATWDDFQIEVKMAKTGTAATTFIRELVDGIQPKFAHELAEMQKLKAADTHDASARVDITDWRYYQNQLVKQRYTIDTEALRVYFPYQRTLQGMFDLYQSLFGLKFEQIEAPYTWADGVTLWAVLDAKTGEPMGLFYLDMFPRDGKYNHFAEFGIQPGWKLPGDSFLRPTVALVCNFPPPSQERPSLLNHEEVSTLFHEFGHCMHAILTRAKFARFSGTSVPGDFVEAPSQMLENWTYDKSVLDTFAADYRDPSKKVPVEILARMKEVRLATIGAFYRRQFSLGLTDLELHGADVPTTAQELQAMTNRVLGDVFLPVPTDSAYVARFAHLTSGYDAGYYGYAWADSIAADMASVFEAAPHGYLDVATGLRLRNEIYSRGDSRDVGESIEAFLGRKRSNAAFLKKLGIP